MTHVVVKSIKRKQSAGRSKVRTKRLRKSDGKFALVQSLDANDDNFIEALTAVFEKNVKRARRENKRLFGSSDGIRAKK